MWEGVSVALRRNRFFGVIGAIACNNVIITASKIRIISARLVTKQELKAYQEG